MIGMSEEDIQKMCEAQRSECESSRKIGSLFNDLMLEIQSMSEIQGVACRSDKDRHLAVLKNEVEIAYAYFSFFIDAEGS